METGWAGGLNRGMAILSAAALLCAGMVRGQTYTDAFPGVSFKIPVWLGEMPGRPGSFLVLEKNLGNIVLVRGDRGAWVRETFANVPAHKYGFEMGLLGLAFHPGFRANRKYYVNYNPGSGPLATVVEERQADESFLKDAGPGKVREILRISQPDANHKGGTMNFGRDGFLYISTGDGGSQGDPSGNGQNTKVLLAKMLRIDVDRKENGREYGIPADNPFADASSPIAGGAREIWAYGLRNPWKWSFDPLGGELWLGDVGGGMQEEVDIIRKGGNYGWSGSEGFYNVGGGITSPVYGFPRSDGRAVIGGFVFRGNPASRYYGHFIVGDYETRRAWALKPNGLEKAAAIPLADLPAKPTSWGTDASGRLYVLGHDNGRIHRLEGEDWAGGPVGMVPREGPLREGFRRVFTGFPGGRLDGRAFGGGETLEILSLRGARVALVTARNPALPIGVSRGIYVLGGLSRAESQDLLLVR